MAQKQAGDETRMTTATTAKGSQCLGRSAVADPLPTHELR
jgi:hypothetical protein